MRTSSFALTVTAALTFIAGVAFVAPRVQAQSASKLLDGVYTEPQAARGKVGFDADCGICHGPDLTGASAPALKGDAFLKRWEFKGLHTLVQKVFDTMPNGYATNVQEAVKVDMVAYILQQNGYPAGKDELKDDLDAMQEVPILIKGGATQGTGALANFTLVQTVGCLGEGPNRTWTLTNTAKPMYTTSPAASNATRAKALIETPAGADTFTLVNAARLKPEAMKGQRVEAKGFIYRDGAESQIAVSALQSLGVACGN
jgi:mono/diheme cytochrome c family protein